MKINKTLIAIVGACLAIGACGASSYNSLVDLDEKVSSQWAQVENQYQRRFDLIPNLVETVKGYAAHESGVLTAVTTARSRAGGMTISADADAQKLAEFQKAQDELGGALGRLLAVSENYPELKANQNFLALQDELEGTENRIAVERKRFNDAAQEYNSAIRRFPKSIFARMMGLSAKSYFQAASEAQSAPKVSF